MKSSSESCCFVSKRATQRRQNSWGREGKEALTEQNHVMVTTWRRLLGRPPDYSRIKYDRKKYLVRLWSATTPLARPDGVRFDRRRRADFPVFDAQEHSRVTLWYRSAYVRCLD